MATVRHLILLAALFTPPAFANPKTPEPTPTPAPQPTSATAQAGAEAAAAAQANGGNANASPVITVGGGQGGGATANGGSSSGVGHVAFESDYLGLSLPGMPAAPAVGDHKCLVVTPMTAVLGSGRGGRTHLDQQCMCIELAKEFKALGFADDARRQLLSCTGAVKQPEPPAPTVAELPDCSVQTDRVLELCAK